MTYDNTVCRFDPRKETFEPILDENATPYQVSSVYAMSSGDIWLLVSGDGALRVTTNPDTGGMSLRLYSKRNHALSADKVNYPYEDKAGNLWLLTDNGLYMEEKGTGVISDLFAGNSRELTFKQSFYDLLETDTEILLGSNRGRIWRYLKKTGQMKLLQIKTDSSVKFILPVKDATWLIGTSHDGFLIYNDKTGEQRHCNMTTCANLPSNDMKRGFVGRQQGIWLHVNALGACRFDTQTEKLTHFVVRDEKEEY